PHLFQFRFQRQKTFIESSGPFQSDFSGVQLVASVALVNVNGPARHNAVPVLHPEGKSSPLSGKHDTGQDSCLILQGKIDMSAGMIFTVGDLSLYINLAQDKILYKHIFHITVDLSYR